MAVLDAVAVANTETVVDAVASDPPSVADVLVMSTV